MYAMASAATLKATFQPRDSSAGELSSFVSVIRRLNSDSVSSAHSNKVSLNLQNGNQDVVPRLTHETLSEVAATTRSRIT